MWDVNRIFIDNSVGGILPLTATDSLDQNANGGMNFQLKDS